MEGDNAGGSSSTTTKRPQSIDKFGTTLIQNVYRYFKAIEDYGPRPTDQVAFSKFGKQNIFRITADAVGVTQATVKKHVGLNVDEIPNRPKAPRKKPKTVRMWLPMGTPKAEREKMAAEYFKRLESNGMA